jgi:hypothetical protein
VIGLNCIYVACFFIGVPYYYYFVAVYMLLFTKLRFSASRSDYYVVSVIIRYISCCVGSLYYILR